MLFAYAKPKAQISCMVNGQLISAFVFATKIVQYLYFLNRGAWCFSGRASDSGARGRGFKIYLCHVVSLSKTLYSLKVLVTPRKLWFRPDMTEQLLTGKLSPNTNFLKFQASSHLLWLYSPVCVRPKTGCLARLLKE